MNAAGRGEAQIGPNAIIQMMGALELRCGPERAGELVRAAGLGGYLESPPQRMVEEREVIALHASVRSGLQDGTARGVARMAGYATGDYLLANRIPAAAQTLLRLMPAALAARLLLAAIARHAWTFAGSGVFAARAGRPCMITLQACPICRGVQVAAPVCDYYAATFERLFARLVQPGARAVETACSGAGASACRFEIAY